MHSTIKLLACTLLFCTACTDTSGEFIETETAVVEGFLFAGHPVDSISITQSFSYIQEDSLPITLNDLALSITEQEQSFALFNIGNGIYQNLDFIPEHGKNYVLEFEHKGEVVRAETFLPEKTEIESSATEIELEKIVDFNFGSLAEIEPIEVTWENEEGDYYYTVVENMEEDPEWVNDLLAEFTNNGEAIRFLQITEPEIADFHIIDPRRHLTQFGTYRIIVFRVNPEYAALYENAGTSSITIAQPPSNVENGLGIFTGVSSDTLFLEVKKI